MRGEESGDGREEEKVLCRWVHGPRHATPRRPPFLPLCPTGPGKFPTEQKVASEWEKILSGDEGMGVSWR